MINRSVQALITTIWYVHIHHGQLVEAFKSWGFTETGKQWVSQDIVEEKYMLATSAETVLYSVTSIHIQ
jgi:hypothetical protein